jgi:hypothetical protein
MKYNIFYFLSLENKYLFIKIIDFTIYKIIYYFIIKNKKNNDPL